MMKILAVKKDNNVDQVSRKRTRDSHNISHAADTDARPVAIVESEREIQIPLLMSQFNAVEKVLNNLYQKKRVADWNSVKDAATRFCGSEILLSDINTIMDIYPEVYAIFWRTPTAEKKSFELCMKLPNEFVGKFETRSNTFRYIFSFNCMFFDRFCCFKFESNLD